MAKMIINKPVNNHINAYSPPPKKTQKMNKKSKNNDGKRLSDYSGRGYLSREISILRNARSTLAMNSQAKAS